MFILNNIQKSKETIGKFTFLRTEYGGLVCSKAFQSLYRINKNTFSKANVISGKTVGLSKTKSKSHNTISLIAWFEEYVKFHGDFMPHKQDVLLPYGSRKLHVYEQYKIETASPVSKSTFFDMWAKHFPHIKIKKTTAFTKCSICGLLERQMQNTLIPEERALIRHKRKIHNDRQMKERIYYHCKREQSRVEPMKYLSLIIDGMDQSKTNLPHFKGRLPKSINPVDLLKTHITGVISHGHGGFHTFTDFNQFPHDPNLTITVILKMLLNTAKVNDGRLPPVLYVQADNCVRENKNRYVLAFLQLLVEKKILNQVHLSFLPVGHTHEDIDARFSLISRDLYQTDTETLDDFVKLLGPHEFVKSVFNVREWLTLSIPKYISGTTEPLHFKFEKVNNKVVTCYKGEHDNEWKIESTGFLMEIPKGKPKHVPADFTDIQDERLLKLIETNKALFKTNDIINKWKNTLKEIKKKKDEKWILPDLPKQNDHQEIPLMRLADEVENVLDKENREPQLLIRQTREQMKIFEKRQPANKPQKRKPASLQSRKTKDKQGKRKCRFSVNSFRRTLVIWLDNECKKHIWFMIFMEIYLFFCFSLSVICLLFVKLFSLFFCLLQFLLLINDLWFRILSIHIGNFAHINLCPGTLYSLYIPIM
ncbi:uncharacterized protein LOC132740023 [Ruditapes philippinarum]|uniref:uncharacterized protein LOC132740023 n=1 Tax=Ruditapes philippinarum TaxID=129788 RepID=UPI00295ABD56|nr:uncharacterized protein LOC132740023 [Ruditapes philippinarum]